MRQSFFDEGYLNCQYTQIEALEKDSSPYFIVEIITLYFRDSPNVIAALEHELMKAAVRDIKKEHSELRAKFETYFQLMRRAGPTEQAVNSS
ncbi:hypothetical protein Bca52824_023031 [Brassica carinata]|uniref:Histidine-containing phosphotransfer protein n=1 Tax=Brassica carinata TaxID=52824 RepID=A0A8X7VHG4_BRACI|nr:hypothetical protein Bca52824_023031 [Brassica carinata]